MPGAIASLTLLVCLISGLLTPDLSWAGAKAEQSKEDLNRLHERIEALKKELDSTREAHKDATDELKASEKAISETNRKLYELSKQHKQNRNALAGLQQQKLEIETTVKEQQDLLGAQLYQRYLHGQQGYIQIVLQQQDPGAIARQLHYYSYVSKARAALIASMQQNLGKIARLNDETASALKALTELKQKQEQERRELQAQKNERNKVLKQLSAKISSQRGEISKLKRDEKRLSQLVERLARIIPKATPKKRSKNTSTGEAVGRNEELPTNAFDGGNFAALKGKLNLPIRGDIANRFGDSREDTGVSWKGLFIRSSEGSEVKSIASGRVVFADWLRGFGNLLIVDHGDGYMSLYGNNQSLLKRVGETVSGGDTIAAVGNSGGNETSGLYFELRHRSKPLDPLGWSKVR
jgi:septal ring factor EnvC (AmiA/AmiB activator)